MTAPLNTALRTTAITAAMILVAGGAGYGLAQLRQRPAPAVAPKTPAGPKVLYWYDPMKPAQHFSAPGKSPFMDMPLTPRYADAGTDGADAPRGVSIDPATVQSLGVRLATAERTPISQSIDASGVVDFDQRDLAIVQARSAGYVQRTYGRAPGDVVRAGAPIVDLMIPAWAGAQQEYLAVRRGGDPPLEAAARQRLRLIGMPDALVAAVARDGQPRPVTTVSSPLGGVIQTLDVRQGMAVAMGQTLIQVAGLSRVWLNAAVPEALAGHLRPGAPARIELAAFPGETRTGRVSALLPATQTDSHTVTARIEMANPSGRMRPGMYAAVHLKVGADTALTVPTEAVIRTGRRALVLAAREHGRFEPVEVRTGRESGDRIEILEGLGDGESVVASGQFLIDSEASLAGLKTRPLPVLDAAPTEGPR